jgi:hypothetical protein
MRKKKENLRLQTLSQTDEPLPEALESDREQRYEEMSGVMATEGVGPGFDTDPEFENSVDSADGPLSQDSMDPPTRPRGVSGSKKSKKKRHPIPASRHAAARSSKKI